MTRHWEPTTLRLTAKQARVLWWLLRGLLDGGGADPKLAVTWRAILRKLEKGTA